MYSNWGSLVSLAVPLLAIAGWASIVLYRMYLMGRAREQKHKERLAMIERGLPPHPDGEAEKIEALTDWNDRGPYRRGSYRRNGVLVMAVGVGLCVMFYAQGRERNVGVGVFVFLIGLAFFINEILDARSRRDEPPAPPRA